MVGVPVTGLWADLSRLRSLDAALTDDPPRLDEWLAAQGPTERRQLWGLLDSQLLLGERVEVHELADGWARVTAQQQPSSRDERGYPGHVRTEHLRPLPTETGCGHVVVRRPVVALRDGPDGDVVLRDVSFGTVLPLIDRRLDGVVVQLPDGRSGWLGSAAVDVVPHTTLRSAAELPTADELITAARQFLGVTYLAAGVHGASFDCSGLVHLVYRRFGVTVPRDARDQLAIGIAVSLDDTTYGDLLFFTNPDTGDVYHVGFCIELPLMLHASQTDWAVLEAPLTDRRRAHLSHARRLYAPARG